MRTNAVEGLYNLLFNPAYDIIRVFIHPASTPALMLFREPEYELYKREALERLRVLFSGGGGRAFEWYAALAQVSFDQPDGDARFRDLCRRLFAMKWVYMEKSGYLPKVMSLRERMRYRLSMLPDADGLPRGTVLRWKLFNLIDLFDVGEVLSWALAAGCAAMVAWYVLLQVHA